MPNFPSIYLELQELWKRINSNSLNIEQLFQITPNPTPYKISINDDNYEQNIDPKNYSIIEIIYTGTTGNYIGDVSGPIINTNLQLGTKLLIYSSLSSTTSFKFTSRSVDGASYNIYLGDDERSFGKGDNIQLILVEKDSEKFWLEISYNNVNEFIPS